MLDVREYGAVALDENAFCGLERLGDDTLMTVSGGSDGWLDILRIEAEPVFFCLFANMGSIVDGAKAGWAAAVQ